MLIGPDFHCGTSFGHLTLHVSTHVSYCRLLVAGLPVKFSHFTFVLIGSADLACVSSRQNQSDRNIALVQPLLKIVQRVEIVKGLHCTVKILK